MPKSLAFKRTLFLLGLQTSVWRPIVIIEIIIIIIIIVIIIIIIILIPPVFVLILQV